MAQPPTRRSEREEFLSIQFARRATGACAALAAVLAVAPAASAASAPTASGPTASAPAAAISSANCSTPTLTQPFASFGDTNEYALAPGETNDNFSATGWKLSGGAEIVTRRLYDGTTGEVLELPGGATAVSPTMCVTNAYSSARAMIKDVRGSAGVAVTAKYTANADGSGASSVSTGSFTDSGTAWSPSSVLNITPLSSSGWQYATFTLTASGTASEYRLYNLYVDPKMRT